MRIRKSCIPLPLSSIDHVQNGAAALTTNHFSPALAQSPETPVIMVTRINGSISSKGGDTDEKKINAKESENEIIKEIMNFCTQAANQSRCKEEKVIPLKKRRISFERNMISKKEKEINESNVSEELRCRRSDGKKWRCGRKKVEGYSMCAHHLEREKVSRSRTYRSRRRRDILSRNRKTNMNDYGKKKITKQVKARSINSLVRNTVPLMLPIT